MWGRDGGEDAQRAAGQGEQNGRHVGRAQPGAPTQARHAKHGGDARNPREEEPGVVECGVSESSCTRSGRTRGARLLASKARSAGGGRGCKADGGKRRVSLCLSALEL